MNRSQLSFLNVAWLQAQIVLNDNCLKLLLIGLSVMVVSSDVADNYKTVVALLTILPFVVFSPLAGWWSDRFPKYRIIQCVMVGQMLVMVLMGLGIYSRHLVFCVVGFALLSTLCAFISPAKLGIIKEYVGSEKLGFAAGLVEMLTVGGILAGGYFGGLLFEFFTGFFHNQPWEGALACVAVFSAVSGVAAVMSFLLEPTTAHDPKPYRHSLFWEHFDQLKNLWRQRQLRNSSLGIAYFYSVGGVIFLLLVDVGAALYPGQAAAAAVTGQMLAFVGAGVVVGTLLSSVMSRGRIEMGLVPVGCLGMMVAYGAAALLEHSQFLFYLILFFGGISSGIYLVPLNAHLQDRVQPGQRGTIMAGMNLLTNLAGVGAILLYNFSKKIFQISPEGYFLILMTCTGVTTLLLLLWQADSLLRLISISVARGWYRVRVHDQRQLPWDRGVLLLCNHTSYIDTIILQLACPRTVRFVISREIFLNPFLNWFYRLMRAIPVDSTRAKEGIREAVRHLQEGEVLCLFPEGTITRDGNLLPFQPGYETIARHAGCAVQPVLIHGLWGSIYSWKGGRYFFKKPEGWWRRVEVVFGRPLEAPEAGPEEMKQAFQVLRIRAEELLEQRRED
ncbi:MAG: MFS transporter [Verrucomicrobiae bacterium]|nr:MFS transporter [Verrucomicrobiae bacterium]